MELSCYEYDLQLRKAFGIAGNSRMSTPVVFVRLEEDGVAGYGEASLPPYLEETRESVIQFLRTLDLSRLGIPDAAKIRSLLHRKPGNYAAKAAVEIALLDLLSKQKAQPAFGYLGLSRETPLNTYTIGIGPLDQVKSKLTDAEVFHVIKVKLGASNDKQIIEEVRKHTSLPLCIDVNQGWSTKEHALDMCHWLAERNVLLIEQPLHKSDLEGHQWLKSRSPLPLYADESFQNISDLDAVIDSFHGINIKLMKCGGPWRALEIVHVVREAGLKILLGSMNESSCANMAAAHLSSLADFTDLDGPFLINNNPFKDPEMQLGRMVLTEKPGLGIEFRESFFNFQERFI